MTNIILAANRYIRGVKENSKRLGKAGRMIALMLTHDNAFKTTVAPQGENSASLLKISPQIQPTLAGGLVDTFAAPFDVAMDDDYDEVATVSQGECKSRPQHIDPFTGNRNW